MTIRPATEADAAEISGLLAELGYPAAAESIARRLAVLGTHPDDAIIVALEGARVVGAAGVHVFSALHADEPVALIMALVVATAARGGGHGRRLVAEMERFARSRGCGRIMVTTANHRSEAHAFYAHLGYDFTGRRYAKFLP